MALVCDSLMSTDEERARNAACDAGLSLVRDERGLALAGDGMELRADFAPLLPRVRPDRLQAELLVRAARIKQAEGPLRAVDATAGFGEDAFLLAAAGFEVTLYETDTVIAALLRDALARAVHDASLAPIVARMHFIEGDSIAAMRALAADRAAGADEAPMVDVVYLDPMFPERRKSAAVKKKFQLLHHLERPCADEAELLAAARAVRPRKIVIKRPVKGYDLAGVKPAYRLSGKAVRYDVIVGG